jgi:arylformamidase
MIVDLTAHMHNGALAHPGDPQFLMSSHSTIEQNGFALSNVSFGTHQGTHIDAPSHVIVGGQTLSDIEAQRFVVRAVLANLLHKRPNEQIDIADLVPISQYIKPGMGVSLATGWDKHIGTTKYFSDSPCITAALAQWLAEQKIGILGVDMPCPCASDWQRVHNILLGAGVLIVEGLINLLAIGPGPFTFAALPLHLTGADGSPVRAIAITD